MKVFKVLRGFSGTKELKECFVNAHTKYVFFSLTICHFCQIF